MPHAISSDDVRGRDAAAGDGRVEDRGELQHQRADREHRGDPSGHRRVRDPPNAPEMNSNGNSTKFTIAGAASSFGMNVAIAAPHAVKQNAPSTTVNNEPEVAVRERHAVRDEAERDRRAR